MVLAYHLIWTLYAHWLPNDPRGSGSTAIRSDVIRALGDLHFGRKRIQPPPAEVLAFYERAEDLTLFPVRTLDDAARARVADAFADVIRRRPYTCYACAIMPDHVHVVIRKHRDRCETMVEQLKTAARQHLWRSDRTWDHHPVWAAGHGWRVYLDSRDDIERTIRYVEKNPRAPQRWAFVTAYDGWPQNKRS